MTESELGGLLRQAILVTLSLAGPPLLLSLVVGTLVAVLQAVTQINESALAYVPKAVALFAMLALLGPFYHATLLQYAAGLFAHMAALGRQ